MILAIRYLMTLSLAWLLTPVPSVAEPAPILRIAVASNFIESIKVLTARFQQHIAPNKIDIQWVSGSSGKLYAQIVRSAPYHVFLSGDVDKPQRLYEQGLLTQPTIYARGQLAFLMAQDCPETTAKISRDSVTEQDWITWLKWLVAKPRTIALANPKFAPYGMAAEQVLQQAEQSADNSLEIQRRTAENIAQSAHFTRSGHLSGGFISAAHAQHLEFEKNCYWSVPLDSYAPIWQAGGVLTKTKSIKKYAQQFMTYLVSDEAQAYLIEQGYQPITTQVEDR